MEDSSKGIEPLSKEHSHIGLTLKCFRQLHFPDIDRFCSATNIKKIEHYLEYENGTREIPISLAYWIADNYGINEDKLLTAALRARKEFLTDKILGLLHDAWGRAPSDATRVAFSLHRARCNDGLSREQMEKDLAFAGITKTQVNQYEQGREKVTIGDAITFAGYFNRNIIEFLHTEHVLLSSGRVNPIFLDKYDNVDMPKLFCVSSQLEQVLDHYV